MYTVVRRSIKAVSRSFISMIGKKPDWHSFEIDEEKKDH
jgi:hypothetical protein